MAIPDAQTVGGGEFEGSGSVWGLKVVKLCSLFRHFYSKMYRLATTHSVTDGQTDRQTDIRQYHANSRSYCVQHYDRLETTAFTAEVMK